MNIMYVHTSSLFQEIPRGHPDCLSGKTFVITGVLESLLRTEAEDAIKVWDRCGRWDAIKVWDRCGIVADDEDNEDDEDEEDDDTSRALPTSKEAFFLAHIHTCVHPTASWRTRHDGVERQDDLPARGGTLWPVKAKDGEYCRRYWGCLGCHNDATTVTPVACGLRCPSLTIP